MRFPPSVSSSTLISIETIKSGRGLVGFCSGHESRGVGYGRTRGDRNSARKSRTSKSSAGGCSATRYDSAGRDRAVDDETAAHALAVIFKFHDRLALMIFNCVHQVIDIGQGE